MPMTKTTTKTNSPRKMAETPIICYIFEILMTRSFHICDDRYLTLVILFTPVTLVTLVTLFWSYNQFYSVSPFWDIWCLALKFDSLVYLFLVKEINGVDFELWHVSKSQDFVLFLDLINCVAFLAWTCDKENALLSTFFWSENCDVPLENTRPPPWLHY